MKKEIQNELDFAGHMVNIEDAENVPLPLADKKTFSDTELEQAGLVKTSAFVRTKRSKNALRIEKHKQKKEELGIKQLNIEVPEQHREAMKQLANALKDGQSITDALKAISTDTKTPEKQKTPQKAPQSVLSEEQINYAILGKKVTEIQQNGGIKAIFLKFIL
jgi:hypothetical protein